MSDDIHISPADGQSAEEVTKVITQAAETQGLDGGTIALHGEEIIVPRSLATQIDSSGLTGFPRPATTTSSRTRSNWFAPKIRSSRHSA